VKPPLALPILLALLLAGVTLAQPAEDAALDAHLRKLFPAATRFTPKGGEPPHVKALAVEAGSSEPVLVGLAFLTTELAPLERGYDGPIKILVGMDPRGMLAGVVVLDHHEPYGDFSVEPPAFAAQFAGKNIRDAFRVGADVDAVSRATITVSSAARAIRDSARRAARTLLTP
jgi:transcriptional regulator of nitric oxide reductase